MTNSQTSTVYGAYALAVSLGLFRAVGARTVQDIFLVVAFTGAEISVAHLLGRKARELDPEIEERQVRERRRGELAGMAQAARDDYARRLKDRNKTINEIEELELASEEDLLLGDAKVLNSICVTAMQRGYRAGIAKNFGDLGGVKGDS